jgi:outer membrane protein assembly factor BamB
MNKGNAWILGSLVCSLVLCGSMSAEDWPRRAGPHDDWTVNEKGLASEWPEGGPKLVWENKEINSGFGTPAVAGGKVFIIDRAIDASAKDKSGNIPPLHDAKFLPGPDVLKCLDKATGKLIWKHEFNTLSDTKATAWNTPAVEGDVVYARGGDGQVRCVSIKDGKSLWAWPKDGEAPFKKDDRKMGLCGGAPSAPSVTICDDMLIMLGGHNGYSSILVGLNKTTGEKVWEHPFGDWLHGANNYTVLDLGTRKVLVIFGEIIDPKTGEKLCSYGNLNGNMTFWCRAAKGNQFYIGFPAIKGQHGEGMVCNKVEVKPDGTLECKEVWTWKPPLTDAQIAEEKLEKSFGGPLLVNGYLYVFMGRKGEGSSVFCVDAATGKDAWPQRGKTAVHFISPVCADGKIYYTNMAGSLFIFAADPKEYNALGAAKVLDRALSSPVISDGCLFSRGDLGGLKCLDLRPPK